MIDLICTCGHKKDDHSRGPFTQEYMCVECSYIDSDYHYHTFKLDNLSYLENKYNETHS